MKTQKKAFCPGTILLNAVALAFLLTANAWAADYQSTVLADHPIGYWPLNLAVDTGGTAADLSGNTNIGTYDGVFAQVPGPSSFITNAVSFDGATTLVDLSAGSHTDLLNFGGTITMEAWVQPATPGISGDILAKGYDSSQTDDELEMRADSGDYHGGTYNDDAGDLGVSGGTESTNWTHVVCTWDGTNWNLYVNGELTGTGADANGAINFNDAWAIGTGTANGISRLFAGNICQVALYTNALTPAQVLTHYLIGLYGTTTPLPAIITQPVPHTVYTNASATFSVTADPLSGPFGYQWYKGASAISDQTNASLMLTNVQAAAVAGYSVVLTNTYGASTSSVAALTLVPPATHYDAMVFGDHPLA
ncbi:MAG TPA: LamG-like jellyroll fold domain-containing protein, partial [Verrucomicrobiae bacterium]|nr:LamG-like jellyroll fold domain-containing protein [Verrucomicrobiae bacterium]